MLAEDLLEQGIRPKRWSSGDQKLLCPKCSATRKNRKDLCLSLTIDGDSVLWNCHNCGWAGAIVAGGLDPRDTSAALGFAGVMKDLPKYTTQGGMLYVFSLP